jgi:hypothetical protein
VNELSKLNNLKFTIIQKMERCNLSSINHWRNELDKVNKRIKEAKNNEC